jgi:hypothetical protein
MPTDSQLNSPDIEQAWHGLLEGIESSREIVRQSRVLLELSQSTRPTAANDDNRDPD